MKQFIYYTSVLFILLQLVACKSDDAVPDTGLVIQVVDANNPDRVFPQSDVYLFDSEAAFTAYISGLSTDFLQTGITNEDGEHTFCGLTSGQQYYFFVENVGLGLSNILSTGEPNQFKLSGGITGQATTLVQVGLQGFIKREIKFFSTDPAVAGNNISIFQGPNTTDAIHTLSQVANGPNGTEAASTFIFAPTNGTFTYYIKNENGCIWTKQITISETQPIISLELEKCGETTYSFYYPGTLATGEEVEVFLNNETTPIGTITARGSCASNNVSVTRPDKKYTYRAEHSNGTCTWVGETTDNCIELDVCN